MDAKTLSIFFLVLAPIIIIAEALQTLRSPRELRSGIHHHSERHNLLPRDVHEAGLEAGRMRPTSMQRLNELRKKPSGHLKPLQEDDMENDEVVSVAIGPPAIRPKYDKIHKQVQKPANRTTINNSISTNLVKDVLVQLGREFLTHQVNEEFVFGQYLGNSMRNLTNELRLKMQHEILDLIVKYHKLSRGEVNINASTTSTKHEEINTQSVLEAINIAKRLNNTDEVWPDFTNLANVVG
ncbi:uncharacterized protein LOC123871852 [Maniola jurtina]|uniref:uncharacterized protein LOC123871852 n=1 Tax=Maniola jurtina TaxID=191418 RepID=UPI001E689B97|nr:uncharacterized protein LOC123871852 [Maniola jurtina]